MTNYYWSQAPKRHNRRLGLYQYPACPVTHLETGEITYRKSAEELGRELGVSKNTLQKHLLCKEGVWKKSLKVEYIRPDELIALGLPE